MKYLELLSLEETQFICASIPHVDVIKYFKKNPKEFSKIRPGFRPAAVTPKDATRLLTNNINRDFISSFVEKTIEMWLSQIQTAYKGYLDKGKSETAAIVHTLSQSYFSDNVTAYFKLTDKDYKDEQISLISDLVYDYKTTKQQIEDLNEIVRELKAAIHDVESEAKKEGLVNKKLQTKLQQALEELESLRNLKVELEGLSSDLQRYKEKVITLENQRKQQNERIDQLLLQISEITKEKEVLESDIVLRIENERKRKLNTQLSVLIRHIYQEVGYLFTDDDNRNHLCDIRRVVDTGNSKLCLHSLQKGEINGLGVFNPEATPSISWREFLIRDSLTPEQYINSKYDIVVFEDRDVDLDDMQFFNPLAQASPSQSWNNRICTEFTVGRKSLLGPFYLIQAYGEGVLYCLEDQSVIDDKLTSFEYRRLYFALKRFYDNPVKMRIKKIDDIYSKLIVQGHLPNREYYLLLLVSWPDRYAFNKTEFIIKNSFLPFVSEVIANLGIEVIGG